MIKVTKPYNRLLRKRRFTWRERRSTKHTLRVAFAPDTFLHRWCLIHFGYSKRMMEVKT